MNNSPYSWLVWLALALATGLIWSEDARMGKVLHPEGAEFHQSLGQVLFAPDGSLYVAYRLRGDKKTSNILRVVRFDPGSDRPGATLDSVIPKARLPRVASHFILSPDSTLLVYAELHEPYVLVTLAVPNLSFLSSRDAPLFTRRDLGPHIKDFSRTALVLSAEKPRAWRPITVESVRELALNPANLNQVIFDQKKSLDEAPPELQQWTRLSGEELSAVLAVDDRMLGFSNLKTEGWIRLFEPAGTTVAALHLADCGVTHASISSDRRFAVAVCERSEHDPQSREARFSRRAVVFEVNSLKLLSSFALPKSTLKEPGADADDVWSAGPSPAIWHGKDQLLVAVPDFSSTIKLYQVPVPTEQQEAQSAKQFKSRR